jgi:hypothetical protein
MKPENLNARDYLVNTSKYDNIKIGLKQNITRCRLDSIEQGKVIGSYKHGASLNFIEK